MRVYAHKPSQLKQEALLHPSRLPPHTIRNEITPRGARANAEGLKGWASTSATTHFAHNFSRIPVYSKSQVSLQAKLTVNTPGDIYEQEADQIAEQVTSMPESQLQRTCACGGGCPRCQNGQTAHDRLQTKRVQANYSGALSAPPIVHEVLNSPGQSLETTTQEFMKSRFGYDFSRVRVHTDARAAESARAVNALAYTVGHNIVFGAGRFAPYTSEGRKLLAHELTHVLQNNQSAVQRQEVPFGVSLNGTVNNQTQENFAACGSESWLGGPKRPTKLGPGKWGDDHPAEGPEKEKLKDIDFIFPSSETPINRKTTGMFKIGANDATITSDPDPKNPKNSKIVNFKEYWEANPKHDKATCQGF
jgi:hypothetical protein